MLEKLMHSPIAWAFFSIISIVSLGYAVYTNIKSKQRRELSFVSKSCAMVRKGKNMLKDFELLYKGKKIPDLTITQYALWNSGNQMLTNSDIVVDQPLRVTGKGPVQILDAYIITESEESNKFSLNITNNTVSFSFDYIAPSDGIILQVIHTGSPKEISVDCKIKGGKPLKQLDAKRFHSASPNSKSYKRLKFVLVVGGIFSILMIVFGIGTLRIGLEAFSPNKTVSEFLMIGSETVNMNELKFTGGLWLLNGILAGICLIDKYRRVFKVGIPAALKNYSENEYFY